jgi:hypothetical protein
MPIAPEFMDVAARLTRVIGEESARKLLHVFGGRRIYVPREIGAAHPISVTIGPEAAAKVGEFFHGTILYFPIVASRRDRILKMADEKAKAQDIATALSVSERLVYSVLAERRERDSQPLLL